ncbi:MAG: hypothetical protein ABEK01_03390 [Candidatus Nanohaloarchaea archaeon]
MKPDATIYLDDRDGFRERWKDEKDYEESHPEFMAEVESQYDRLVDRLGLTPVTLVEGEDRMVEKAAKKLHSREVFTEEEESRLRERGYI